jgi:hypothetical protein
MSEDVRRDGQLTVMFVTDVHQRLLQLMLNLLEHIEGLLLRLVSFSKLNGVGGSLKRGLVGDHDVLLKYRSVLRPSLPC